MKLYHYLNENRSQSITPEKFNELLNKNCSDITSFYNKQSRRIFRGLTHNLRHIYINPTKSTRVSANTLNYYSLLFDDILPSWKKYPKRSKSIICTTNTSKAMGYGTLYKVYPYNGCHIGECSGSDIWDSFRINLDSFNDILIKLGTEINFDLKETSSSLNDFISEVSDLFDDPFDGKSWFIKEYFKSEKSFQNYLNQFFNPDKNGFNQYRTNNLSLNSNREVWIEGECLMEII